MTLITITHLAGEAHSRQQANQLSANSMRQNMKLNLISSNNNNSFDADDQLSLNSSSPHSSLTSPFSGSSTGYGGSQRCLADRVQSPGCESTVSSHSSGIHDHNNKSPAPSPFKSILEVREDPEDQIAHHRKLSSNSDASSTTSSAGSLSPQSPVSLSVIAQPVRRLSRIEHRQSLSDLGYGKIESYARLQRLGKGTYATVYMGRSRLSNDLVALKEILKEHDEGAPCTAIREVSLLRLLRHNNIVTLHDICHTPKKLTLVFEYVGPDLYAYMKENNHLLSIHNVRVSTVQVATISQAKSD